MSGRGADEDAEEAEATDMMCCASCGMAEVDDVKMKKCTECDLVRYCSDKCQRDHRPKHERVCKKRAVELRDEILFKQPEGTHLGDCPICFLPLPLYSKKSMLHACCSKIICNGCDYTVLLREREERLQQTCPFCRHPRAKTDEETDRNLMKRIAANDPVALRQMGTKHYNKGDYDTAFVYWAKAAGLGNADAHYNLSILYREGKGVEKDEEKELYHLEEAAIAGHPDARYNLGCDEGENGKIDRAVKHFIIAANLGDDDSIHALKQCYVDGVVRKEDFAAALRAHQAAVDATKSPQRDEAAKAIAAGENR